MRLKFTLLSFFIIILFSIKLSAQDFWHKTDENTLASKQNIFATHYKPQKFAAFTLQETAFRSMMNNAPSDKNVKASKSNFIITVPVANGKTEKFRIVESSVFEPGLAARHPEIKTYIGQGVDEPSSTISFAITPEGFTAQILSAVRKTIYIKPVDKATNSYIVFDRDGMESKKEIFDCAVDKIINSAIQGNAKNTDANDGKLRTYRLALSVNG
jgi:hypothetical protein